MKDPRLDQPISAIYRLYNGRRRPGPDQVVRHPEWTRRLLEALGRPDDSCPAIMVTGSKGKGSTAFYLATVLEAHGFTVGFFSSPHLVDNLERIRVNRRAITPESFLESYAAVAPALAQLAAAIPDDQYLGPVGVFAALAAWHFRAQGADVAVYETGRGARFDDVAEVHHEGAIITRILLEHRRELGPTLADIAWHKAGIVRPETGWVIAPHDPHLTPWLAATGAEWLADDLRASRVAPAGPGGIQFTLTERAGGPAHHARLPALAAFAAANAVQALEAARRWLGPRFSWTVALEALRHARFPGRGDLLSTTPPTLLDGAVRRESARAVAAAVAARFPGQRLASIVGVPADKDWAGVARVLEPLGPLVFAAAQNPRLHFPEAPHRRFPGSRLADTLPTAWRWANDAEPDLILMLGTQSLVADALEFFGLDEALLDLSRPREDPAAPRTPAVSGRRGN